MKKSIVIDGNSLIYRMFYGIREMSNAKGVPTNALYGFTNVLIKIKEDYAPDYLAVAFDLSGPTFRHESYEEYKAGRDKMPEDLVLQLGMLKELLKAMDIAVLSKQGYEADDIVGTLARRGEAQDIATMIMTGDRDSFQLVNKDVQILYTATRSGSQFADVNTAYIDEKYGVTPEELKTVKALMGDKSDNIPGIAGIGEKTALKLVKEYHTLDNLYAHVDEQKGKLKERLILGKESAYTSLYLGTINCDVPIDTNFENLKFGPILTDASRTLMEEYGFKSILKRLDAPVEDKALTEAPARSIVTVAAYNEVSGLLSKLNRIKAYTVCVHTEGERVWLGLELDGFYYYLEEPAAVRQFIGGLNEIPEADAVETSGNNLKQLEKLYNSYKSVITNYAFDSHIASYLLDPSGGRYDLSDVAMRWLDEVYPTDDEFYGKGKARKSAEALGSAAMANRLTGACDIVKRVRPVMLEKIQADGMDILFRDIELALEPVLADMEEAGFKIDVPLLEALSEQFAQKTQRLAQEIYELAGTEFNIGSPKQLGEVLFEKLGLPAEKKTKTGYSTNAEVLESLKAYHPIIERILEYRTISKLDSTYGKGLMSFIDPNTQKIYSTFQQTVTATGRISSTDPNLQNIPVKTEEGRELRKVFVASGPDRVLVDADYSQIELRILAALSGDPTLLEAFAEGKDVHTATAAKVFKEAPENVTSTQRRFAKMINFGLIYGKQAFSLAKDLDVTRGEAQDFIDRYFAEYPKVQEYLNSSIEFAKENGYAQTLWGRRRYIPEIHSRNRMLVQAGERIALNMPIQGAAADIMKLAMIGVNNQIKEQKFDAKLILQVHDELIIDVSEKDAEAVKAMLIDQMENVVSMDVKLSVEAHTGKSWYEAK